MKLVYKYYAPKDYNLDAIEKQYFYFRHVSKLNDPFDSNILLFQPEESAYIIDSYRAVGFKPIQAEGTISIAYIALSLVGLDVVYAGSRPVAHGDTLYVGHLVFHGACVVGQRNGSRMVDIALRRRCAR